MAKQKYIMATEKTKAIQWYNSLTESGKKNLLYYYSKKEIVTEKDIFDFYLFCKDPGYIMPVNDYS